jgi:hypothetical protein
VSPELISKDRQVFSELLKIDFLIALAECIPGDDDANAGGMTT